MHSCAGKISSLLKDYWTSAKDLCKAGSYIYGISSGQARQGIHVYKHWDLQLPATATVTPATPINQALWTQILADLSISYGTSPPTCLNADQVPWGKIIKFYMSILEHSGSLSHAEFLRACTSLEEHLSQVALENLKVYFSSADECLVARRILPSQELNANVSVEIDDVDGIEDIDHVAL